MWVDGGGGGLRKFLLLFFLGMKEMGFQVMQVFHFSRVKCFKHVIWKCFLLFQMHSH